jgi:hypothetical protein
MGSSTSSMNVKKRNNYNIYANHIWPLKWSQLTQYQKLGIMKQHGFNVYKIEHFMEKNRRRAYNEKRQRQLLTNRSRKS